MQKPCLTCVFVFICDMLQASPALHGCLLCWHKGHRVGHKTVYPNNWVHLPPGHHLRSALHGKHLTPVRPTQPVRRAAAGRRGDDEEAGDRTAGARGAGPSALHRRILTRRGGGAVGGTAVQRRAALFSPASASHGTVVAARSAQAGSGNSSDGSDGGSSSGSESLCDTTNTEASGELLETEPAAGQGGSFTPAQSPWPVGMLPAPRRLVFELETAAFAPCDSGGQEVRPGPWRAAFTDPVGVASPLYELLGFNPLLGINYDAMHTIGGVIKDTIIFYIQGRRARKPPMVLYDRLHGIVPIAGGRGKWWVAARRSFAM